MKKENIIKAFNPIHKCFVETNNKRTAISEMRLNERFEKLNFDIYREIDKLFNRVEFL